MVNCTDLRPVVQIQITLSMTLMMTSTQVVETSVNVTNNSPSWDYSHLDNQTTQRTIHQTTQHSQSVFHCIRIYGKWFEPRSLSRLCGLIIWVRVVPRRTVVGDIDRRFDNLSVSHHQSHVNCVASVYGIYVSGQLSRDVIGCWFVKSCCYLL